MLVSNIKSVFKTGVSPKDNYNSLLLYVEIGKRKPNEKTWLDTAKCKECNIEVPFFAGTAITDFIANIKLV